MEPVTDKRIIYRRDTKTYDLILKRDGAPINLAGYTPHFSARQKIDGALLFDKECVIITADEGRCQVTLSSVDTSVLCENGVAEIMIETEAGAQDTLGQFYIDIVQDVKTS